MSTSCTNEALQIAASTPFTTSTEYFRAIYRVLATRMNSDKGFLRDQECLSIYKLYQHILQNSGHFTLIHGSIPSTLLAHTQPQQTFQLRCFSLFAPYHFLTGVITPHRTVDIYQSFGSSMRLHHQTRNMREVDDCINILMSIKRRGKSFVRDYKNMLYVEKTLYGVPISSYLQKLQAHVEEQDAELSDIEEEIIGTPDELAFYDSVHLTHSLGAYLQESYERSDSELIMTMYAANIKHNKGGKSVNKKNSRMTVRKMRLSKSKRKRRNK